MDHIRRVVVGFGSNLGDRRQNIAAAILALRGDGDVHVMAQSPIYVTEAEGGPPGQGAYLNGALLVLTALEARDLLMRLHTIETSLGRTRDVLHGPRTLDLDILWIEGETICEDGLVVPHAQLLSRAFMLRPLLDVAGDASDAESGLVFADHPLAQTSLRKAS